MQIQFDPRDRNACGSVMAAILALHPDLAQIGVEFEAMPDEPQADQADPAQAFDGATDPAAAFPPVPFASPAPAAAIAGEPAGSTATPNSDPAQAAPTTPVLPAEPAAAPQPPTGAQSAAPAPGVELDAKGLPWDGRIHAGKASAPIKVADGSWRKRRGVDDATVAQVEAELRQVMAAPGPNAAPAAGGAAASPEMAPAPAPTAAPAAPTPTPPAAGMEPGPGVATPAASPPPPPVAGAVPLEPAPVAATPPATAAPSPAAPAPASPAAGDALTLPVLMRKITALQTAGTLTVADTNAVAVSLGLTSVRDLVQRPDLIASFDALLPEQAA